MLSTSETSLKRIRAGNRTMYGYGVTLLVKNFQREEGAGRTSLLFPFFSSFTSTRMTKDLLPSVGLISIAFDAEK